jgi:hypothetical protein
MEYLFGVADLSGDDANLEIRADPDRFGDVQFAVRTLAGFGRVRVEPDAVDRLAGALDQRSPIEVPALDDYNGHAELHVVWSSEGAELRMVLRGRSLAAVIDYAEQPRAIAGALRYCRRPITMRRP